MPGLRFDRIVAGTAFIVVLMLIGVAGGVLASTDSREIEVDVPEHVSGHSDVSVTDAVRPAAPASAPVGLSPATYEDIPLPEPANVPPPTIRDIGGPAFRKLTEADIPIVERLRILVASKELEQIIERKRERDAVVAFYTARIFVPLWIENGAASERAAAAMGRLKAADADGLDPADYAVPQFRTSTVPRALAEAELRLTGAVLTYARHAQSGRVHFSRIHSDIFYNLAAPEPSDILAKVAEAKDVGEVLAGYHPPLAGYKALKAQLAAVRRTSNDHSTRVPDGPILHLGMNDLRIPLIHKRLAVSEDEASDLFDENVLAAVKRFQESAGIHADGLVGPRTLQAMNEERSGRRVDIIIANMERWRWMPRDLGKSYSMLNIPDFSLKVVRDGATVWQTKVVVGKPSTPTPILSDTMKFITFNPTWNVPPTIMNNEYLPALRQDPTVLDRMGIRVVRNPDGSVRMYQPPGDENALGRLRFNFPNKFLVYQHDTPDKHLFDRAVRAYSNGCMRIEDPLKYAEVLLATALPKSGYSRERLHRMYSNVEQNLNFETPVPVHLTYQTAFVDETGKLVIRDDIYGHDARILAMINGPDRRFADIAVPNVHRHADDPGPRGPRLVSSHRTSAGEPNRTPLFFERLFRE